MGQQRMINFPYVRNAITMPMLIERYRNRLKLEERNGKYYGPCPVHNGSNPTQFAVTPPNKWKCFGDCVNDQRFNNGGGNALDFVRAMEGLDTGNRGQDTYSAALLVIEWEGLGDDAFLLVVGGNTKVSVAIPPEPECQDTDERVREEEVEPDTVNEPLSREGAWYLDRDYDHPYLITDRGLSSETTRYFGLGHYVGKGKLMQNRILIPIHNAAAEIVAFCGRWVGEAPAGTPKYVLPAGFHKSLELFNIHRVPEEMSEVILVEGYFDVFALHTQGYMSVVAAMGSSLSQCQCELLAERFNSVKIFFDGNALDQARTVARQLEDRLFVKVIPCPEEKQPEHLSCGELTALIA